MHSLATNIQYAVQNIQNQIHQDEEYGLFDNDQEVMEAAFSSLLTHCKKSEGAIYVKPEYVGKSSDEDITEIVDGLEEEVITNVVTGLKSDDKAIFNAAIRELVETICTEAGLKIYAQAGKVVLAKKSTEGIIDLDAMRASLDASGTMDGEDKEDVPSPKAAAAPVGPMQQAHAAQQQTDGVDSGPSSTTGAAQGQGPRGGSSGCCAIM